MFEESGARLVAALEERFGSEPAWETRENRTFGLYLFYRRVPVDPPLREIRAVIDELFNHRIGVIIGVKGRTAAQLPPVR